MPKNPFHPSVWQLAHGKSLTLGPTGRIMGIVNVTPDSFSDGGKHQAVEDAVAQARRMAKAGASIIDIGGESTRPGAAAVSAEVEQGRVLPVIEALKEEAFLISIDTWRADTADRAIKAGAHIINDVWGFQKDQDIAYVAAKTGAGCVLMHTGRDRVKNDDVIIDQLQFLEKSIAVAQNAGVNEAAIVLDPGFGFAKDVEENLELLARFDELLKIGFPILTGTSRKRFIGSVTARGANRRDVGTAATTVVARLKGSAVFRVHDVPKNRDALRIADAVLAAGPQ